LSFPFRPPNTGILYVFSVVLVSLFAMAFLWFVMYAAFTPIRAGITAAMTPYDVENSTYTSFEYADTFMSNFWAYFLVILILGLAYWAYIYSQRKQASGAYYA